MTGNMNGAPSRKMVLRAPWASFVLAAAVVLSLGLSVPGAAAVSLFLQPRAPARAAPIDLQQEVEKGVDAIRKRDAGSDSSTEDGSGSTSSDDLEWEIVEESPRRAAADVVSAASDDPVSRSAEEADESISEWSSVEFVNVPQVVDMPDFHYRPAASSASARGENTNAALAADWTRAAWLADAAYTPAEDRPFRLRYTEDSVQMKNVKMRAQGEHWFVAEGNQHGESGEKVFFLAYRGTVWNKWDLTEWMRDFNAQVVDPAGVLDRIERRWGSASSEASETGAPRDATAGAASSSGGFRRASTSEVLQEDISSQMFPVGRPFAQVGYHRGFLNHALGVPPGVVKQPWGPKPPATPETLGLARALGSVLREMEQPNNSGKLLIAGHSLGGAAALAMGSLLHRYPETFGKASLPNFPAAFDARDRVKVLTFGAPGPFGRNLFVHSSSSSGTSSTENPQWTPVEIESREEQQWWMARDSAGLAFATEVTGLRREDALELFMGNDPIPRLQPELLFKEAGTPPTTLQRVARGVSTTAKSPSTTLVHVDVSGDLAARTSPRPFLDVTIGLWNIGKKLAGRPWAPLSDRVDHKRQGLSALVRALVQPQDSAAESSAPGNAHLLAAEPARAAAPPARAAPDSASPVLPGRFRAFLNNRFLNVV